MTRRIPIFEYNEELKSKKQQVYKSLIEGVTEAIKTDKEEIKLCEVKNANIFITVEKQEWKKSLDSALQFYIDKEEYEKCSKIKDLINKL
jgi:protein-arginine kinase activator protein McsA